MKRGFQPSSTRLLQPFANFSASSAASSWRFTIVNSISISSKLEEQGGAIEWWMIILLDIALKTKLQQMSLLIFGWNFHPFLEYFEEVFSLVQDFCTNPMNARPHTVSECLLEHYCLLSCLGVSPGTLDVRTFCIREFTKDITNLFYSRPKIGLKIGYYLWMWSLQQHFSSSSFLKSSAQSGTSA